MKKSLAGIAGAFAMALSCSVSAQFLIMPDSTNNRLVLFNPFDGSVVNSNWAPIAASTTPIHAMQVGNEVWVSMQVGDRLERYDLAGNVIGSVTGGMDNIRGMELANGTVYVCNDGTGNGAPGDALVMFDTSGNSMGFVATPGVTSPFGILDHQGGLLVSSSAANDDIHRYTYAGTPLGTFHNSTSLNFAEQMNYATNGDILVAGFSSPTGIYRLDPNTGAIITSYAVSAPRGVYQLGNGNIMYTNASGAHVFDVNTGGSTQVYAGGGRYIDFVVIPTPGAIALLGVAGLLSAGSRRRRN